MSTETKTTDTEIKQYQEIQEAIAKPLLTTEEFEALIKEASGSSDKTRKLIQTVAFEALRQAMPRMVEETNEAGETVEIDRGSNYDYANKVMAMVNVSLSESNMNQLKRWFEAYGAFRWVKTEDKTYQLITNGYKFRKDKSENANAFDLEQAYVRKWWAIPRLSKEEQRAINAFTFDKFETGLENLISRIEKAIEKDNFETEEDKTNSQELLAKLKPIVEAEEVSKAA